MLLHYSDEHKDVIDLQIIHHSYITESCIIPRKPLGHDARRAGWQGCIIDLGRLPDAARVFLVKDRIEVPWNHVNAKWKASNAISAYSAESRSWIADVLAIVEKQPDDFCLSGLYEHEHYLSQLHPKNRNVQAKIRQQLQVLRDMGVIEFKSPGDYKKTERSKARCGMFGPRLID